MERSVGDILMKIHPEVIKQLRANLNGPNQLWATSPTEYEQCQTRGLLMRLLQAYDLQRELEPTKVSDGWIDTHWLTTQGWQYDVSTAMYKAVFHVPASKLCPVSTKFVFYLQYTSYGEFSDLLDHKNKLIAVVKFKDTLPQHIRTRTHGVVTTANVYEHAALQGKAVSTE